MLDDTRIASVVGREHGFDMLMSHPEAVRARLDVDLGRTGSQRNRSGDYQATGVHIHAEFCDVVPRLTVYSRSLLHDGKMHGSKECAAADGMDSGDTSMQRQSVRHGSRGKTL